MRGRSIVLAAALLAGGCSTQAVYEGVKQKAQADCRNENRSRTAQDCAQGVNSRSYEDYQKERAGRR